MCAVRRWIIPRTAIFDCDLKARHHDCIGCCCSRWSKIYISSLVSFFIQVIVKDGYRLSLLSDSYSLWYCLLRLWCDQSRDTYSNIIIPRVIQEAIYWCNVGYVPQIEQQRLLIIAMWLDGGRVQIERRNDKTSIISCSIMLRSWRFTQLLEFGWIYVAYKPEEVVKRVWNSWPAIMEFNHAGSQFIQWQVLWPRCRFVAGSLSFFQFARKCPNEQCLAAIHRHAQEHVTVAVKVSVGKW